MVPLYGIRWRSKDAALRAMAEKHYHCVVLADCTAEPIANDQPRTNHEASLLTIRLLFGWVSESGRLERDAWGPIVRASGFTADD